MIWTAAEIAAILAECFIIARMLILYFGFRKPERKHLHAVIIFLCLAAVDLTGTYLIKTEFVLLAGFLISQISLSLFLLKGNPFEKIFISMLNYIMAYFANLPLGFAIMHIMKISLEEYAYYLQGPVRASSILLTKVFFFILTEVVLWFHVREQLHFKRAEWVIFISAFGSSLLISLSILLIAMGSELTSYLYVMITVMLCLLDIIVYVFLQRLNAANRQENAQKMLALQMAQQQTEIERMNQQHRELSILRHDFKNQIACIRSLLEQGDSQKALAYIDTLTERKFGNIALHVQSSSSVVNAVLNVKLGDAHIHGIETSCRIAVPVPEYLEYDVSVLLSNLLDNAVEACRAQTTPSEIIVSFTEKGGYYMLLVKNTITESVLSKNRNLVTSKAERHLHGWGLKSVADIARIHNGSVDFYETDGMFAADVLLSKQS